ncbi:prepilin-type N-terminal cleavage/methylation domain-containing protein [Patescibacteria group bacterium]|nr:prepilin-type N-terminal cleavage/methylation domain-containing protein [Patescibacteria group bacterium]MBU1970177.1 prepilin-type N-terminal cleavage/methylation domain-containing protein [Patescibacteria group bacterium]
MNQKGFTLMEVVVAVSLLGVVSVVSVSVVANLLKSAVKTQALLDTEQTASFVLLKLTNDLEQAGTVSVVGNTLKIYQIGSNPVDVEYRVEVCNAATGISCLKRKETDGAFIPLTDASSDPDDASQAGKSAVGVSQLSGASYFSLINDTSVPPKPVAVNVSMRFDKPDVTDPGAFYGESTLDTTIVLPTPQ